ncbi:CpaF/VirB11 family protein [Acinetobacter guillouiae]|uniref:CpaF/VirB11 family protein n=1 Tax=Acinetobacter guillouiae TaxID=106649 RepID=UPI0021D23413|nr:CpaF/VirB11 family protein [Acinetobacter guillouiae]
MKYLINISGEIPHAGITNINIPLNGKNLIITGKNGSGKTSFLNLLSNKVQMHLNKETQKQQEAKENLNFWINKQKNTLIGSLEFTTAENQINYKNRLLDKINGGLQLNFIEEFDLITRYDNLQAVFVSFKAMRMASITETKQTSSIEDEKIQQFKV